MTTIESALRDAISALNAAGIESAARDARALVAHAAGIHDARVMLERDHVLTAEQRRALSEAIARRSAHEPVAKIRGVKQFWGREFKVNAHVLDPRPETETLIASALEGPVPETVLDLGTGSGAIALTLAAECPEAQVLATDLSDHALSVAQENAAALNLLHRVRIIKSDWFADVVGQFDLIVSNPPYIAQNEMQGLSQDVRKFDPEMALTDYGDGLSAYRVIATQSPAHLRESGRVLVEIGATQGQSVAQLFRTAGFADVRVIVDLDGRDRVVCAKT